MTSSKENTTLSYFNLQHSTTNFVLYSIATCGLYYFYMLFKIAFTVNDHEKAQGRKLIPFNLILVAVGACAWLPQLANWYNSYVHSLLFTGKFVKRSDFETAILTADTYITLSILIGWILLLIVAFKTMKGLRNCIQDENIKFESNEFWTFLFQFFYIYHVIFNIEKYKAMSEAKIAENAPDNSTEALIKNLEALAKLKERGFLTDEEFNQKKQEILNNKL